MELASTDETMLIYPRVFAFRMIYELQGGSLSVTYEVDNRDERIMYFGLGVHPGFNVPLRGGERFEDYRLPVLTHPAARAGLALRQTASRMERTSRFLWLRAVFCRYVTTCLIRMLLC